MFGQPRDETEEWSLNGIVAVIDSEKHSNTSKLDKSSYYTAQQADTQQACINFFYLA